MATAVQERKAEKAGFTSLSCNCLELDWQKNTDTMCWRWLVMNFDFAIFVGASVHEPFLFTLSQMLGMLVLALSLVEPPSHTLARSEIDICYLSETEACVDAHTVEIKLLLNTCGPDFYVIFQCFFFSKK